MQTKENRSTFLASVDLYSSEKRMNAHYVEYKDKMYRLALSYVKDYYLAEDLAHEILVKCYLKREKFRGESSFRAWMNRVAINHCLDFLRKGYLRRDLLHENVALYNNEAVSTPECDVLHICENEELRNKLGQLPFKYKQVLFLYYFENQSLKEIQQVLNVKLSTVKTRLFRAKRMLRDKYE
ncbi:RNA polymerase sigma-54 factor RpoN [Gracilibacillus boraciitolerans JCM 21714]|uniref:RNA polymerase sigma-54 factor RpoN n=1 Tax=Gracilibacillus boraciitolerans JCM 21714 TaxID=1298598 RepID=W4VQ00_9BACI|nr:sigma-70 family RNA polymerase sigma factor [Gracilibacillus boraciitolerans]GAE94839.1 RNA polymerase sigma-54 factor RpoN [Gracilibacillus boraciitolerans JCM 21714]